MSERTNPAGAATSAESAPKRWAEAQALAVAHRVRMYREERGWRAADLAQACAQVGYPIPRNVLLKIEGGYRRYLTTSELFVLSAALGVPPLALLLPVGQQEPFELTPGRTVPTDVARHWFEGSAGLDDETSDWPQANLDALQALRAARERSMAQAAVEPRHPSTEHVLRYFDAGHLPEDLRDVSELAGFLARAMVAKIPDGPELTVGLRKLLEAKDCFVRAALDARSR